MSKPAKLLVEQRQALWDYLDALLQEIPEDPVEAQAPPTPTVAAAEEIQDWDPAALAPPVVADAAPAIAPVVAVPQPVEVAAPAPVDEEAMAAPAPDPEPVIVEGGVPAWAQPDFQALLFSVDGLTLAVPLVKLHSVVPWSDKITALPNQPDWCRGITRYRDRNVKIVDTGRLVIPEEKRAQLQPLPPRHILIVGDGQWGLVCSSVGEVVRLAPHEVKWRSARGRRPWLAGTVLEHLCALMDTEAFAGMLAGSADAPRARSTGVKA